MNRMRLRAEAASRSILIDGCEKPNMLCAPQTEDCQEDALEGTDLQVRLRNEDKLKGFVDVTLDSCVIVHGCRITQSSTGYFVHMRSQKKADGTHRGIAHPIDPRMQQRIEDSVIKANLTELRSRAGPQLTSGDAIAQLAVGSGLTARPPLQEDPRAGSQNMEPG
jgi:stage V sporulation protein G